MPRYQTITTIYFDGQFWVALIERLDGETVMAARHVFGPEPGNAELLDWAGRGFDGLVFCPAPGRAMPEPPANPKRRQREAAAEARRFGLPSRARDALKAMSEMQAANRKAVQAKAHRDETARRYADRVKRKKSRRQGKS